MVSFLEENIWVFLEMLPYRKLDHMSVDTRPGGLITFYAYSIYAMENVGYAKQRLFNKTKIFLKIGLFYLFEGIGKRPLGEDVKSLWSFLDLFMEPKSSSFPHNF